MMALILGIDTSCYTSSVAVVNQKEELLFNKRKILSVPVGKRGLRQSEALFQHTNNLPELIEEISEEFDFSKLQLVSVSSRPRPLSDSYMPVFLSGISFARVISKMLNIPVKYFSHQEGHLMAGAWSAKAMHLYKDSFLCFHISGGTTELLMVNPSNQDLSIDILGGTKDLHAGQFIDRIGVSLGLAFPCGAELEKMAMKAEKKISVPVSTKESWINFSGPETYLQRLIQQEGKPEDIALGTISCITESVLKVLEYTIKKTNIKNVLMVGGVCANQIMRKRLETYFQEKAAIYFANPEFSTDNAVGTALLGLRSLHKE